MRKKIDIDLNRRSGMDVAFEGANVMALMAAQFINQPSWPCDFV